MKRLGDGEVYTGRAAGGRPGSFEALIERYRPNILALVSRRVSDRELAEDITQESLLRAYRFKDLYNPEAPLWPWLSKIAVRVAANALRQRRNRLSLEMESLTTTEQSTRLAETPDERILSDLPPRYRRVLLMHHVLGLTRQDIAKEEGIALSSARVLLSRATRAFIDIAKGAISTLSALVLAGATALRLRASYASRRVVSMMPVAESASTVAAASLAIAFAVLAMPGSTDVPIIPVATVQAVSRSVASAPEPSAHPVSPRRFRGGETKPRVSNSRTISASVGAPSDSSADGFAPIHCDAGLLGEVLCDTYDSIKEVGSTP